VAFIWKVPGLTPKGARCGRVVESIDVFPTLFDLCNIPQPETIEGISMKKLLRDPAATWKKGAITWRAGSGDRVAIQTERYRLNKRLSDGFLELYDHQTDPGEFRNVAKDGRYRDAVEELTRLLDRGWKACLPPS
jgi:arylsulfatase A-like enzyme